MDITSAPEWIGAEDFLGVHGSLSCVVVNHGLTNVVGRQSARETISGSTWKTRGKYSLHEDTRVTRVRSVLLLSIPLSLDRVSDGQARSSPVTVGGSMQSQCVVERAHVFLMDLFWNVARRTLSEPDEIAGRLGTDGVLCDTHVQYNCAQTRNAPAVQQESVLFTIQERSPRGGLGMEQRRMVRNNEREGRRVRRIPLLKRRTILRCPSDDNGAPRCFSMPCQKQKTEYGLLRMDFRRAGPSPFPALT